MRGGGGGWGGGRGDGVGEGEGVGDVVDVVLVVGDGGRVFEGSGSARAFVREGEDGVGEAVDEFVVGAKVDAGGEGVGLGVVVGGGVRSIFLRGGSGGRSRSGWCLQLLFHLLFRFSFSLEAFARRDGSSLLDDVVLLFPGIPEVFRGRVGWQRCVLVCWRDGAALLGVGAEIPGVGAPSLDLHFGEGSLCAPLFDGSGEVW